MLEATNAGVIVTDPHQPDNPIIFANPAAAVMTGYGITELVGQNYRILFGPGTDPKGIDRLRQARQGERPGAATLLHYRNDGTPFWANLSSSPMRGPGPRLAGVISLPVDTTPHQSRGGEAPPAPAPARPAHPTEAQV